MPIMNYRIHQRRLIPLLATTYCHHFAADDLYRRFGIFGQRPADRASQRANHLLSSGMKSLCSWHMITTLQMCREACGGQGVKSSNLIGIFKSDMDVHATYEGDNWVLLQTVAKGIFGDTFPDPRDISFAHEDTRGTEFQLAAFRYREADAMKRLKQAITERTGRGLALDDAWNETADLATDAGRAHIERRNLEQFILVPFDFLCFVCGVYFFFSFFFLFLFFFLGWGEESSLTDGCGPPQEAQVIVRPLED